MTRQDDPVSPIGEIGENPNGDRWYKQNGGLTKREYFAAVAMTGLCANTSGLLKEVHKMGVSTAKLAVAHADNLIAALNEKQ